MKHVLITGGSGFVGSHLCDRFLKEGYAVTAVDNFITGRKSNVSHLEGNPNFQLIEQDVSRPLASWPKSDLIRKHGLSGVLHFACPASPVDFDKIPFEILAVDSVGTAHTVELALEHKARYLLASTSEIYGDPLVHPQTEDYFGNVNTIGPRACYDETKRFAEAYVTTAARHSNLNVGIVRIFNTYGPRMRPDDGRVVPELCMQALKGEALTVHGDGMQTRSFCFVSDLVDGIFKLFESDVRVPVNIGNPAEYPIKAFADAILRITGGKGPLKHLPGREDDPKKRCPEITRARTLLKWEPKIPLEEGLKRSLEYFKSC